MDTSKMIRCRRIFFSNGLVNQYNILKIAICNDEQKIMQFLRNEAYEILKKENVTGTVDEFEQLNKFWEHKAEYDIIFLSIEMCENEVLRVASEIKKECLHSKLVLTSESAKYMQDAYKVQPFRYLLNTDSGERIEETICSAIANNKRRTGLILEEGGEHHSILLRNILYIETIGDEIVITTDNQKQFIIRMTLKNIYHRLEDDFVRCNREKIVNIRQIKKVRDREVILNNGMVITVSYREKKNVVEKYRNYLFQLMDT